jgi:CheY-like chemotaxis protein
VKNKKICWIDDDINILGPVLTPLEEAGYTIQKIYSLHEARQRLEIIREADLVILDLIMPPNTEQNEKSGPYPGADFLTELRRDHNIRTPVLLFSVVRRGEILEKLKAMDGVDIISKPVRPQNLKERVERILGEIGKP